MKNLTILIDHNGDEVYRLETDPNVTPALLQYENRYYIYRETSMFNQNIVTFFETSCMKIS